MPGLKIKKLHSSNIFLLISSSFSPIFGLLIYVTNITKWNSLLCVLPDFSLILGGILKSSLVTRNIWFNHDELIRVDWLYKKSWTESSIHNLKTSTLCTVLCFLFHPTNHCYYVTHNIIQGLTGV